MKMGRVYNKVPEKSNSTSNGDGTSREEDALPTDMSDTSETEPDNENNDFGSDCPKCTSPHDGKLIMQQQFPFGADELFTMIFTNCKFNIKLRAARAISNYEEVPWKAQNGLKCRRLCFTLGLSSLGPVGPKEVQVTETQVMNKCSKPGALYSIDSTGENGGVPYSDYFTVCAHYCLQRVSRNSTLLSLYGQVKYKKYTVFKSFIEKNAINGLYDFYRILEVKLNEELEAAAPSGRKSRPHRRLNASSSAEREASPPPATAPPRPLRWLVVAVLVLVAVNVLLYWALARSKRTPSLFELQTRLSAIQSTQTVEWSNMLEKHSARQNEQLARWREALHATVQHLMLTEQALTTLLDSIKPSLESAQREAQDTFGIEF